MIDLIVGMGEVGSTVFKLLTERGFTCSGYDLIEKKQVASPYQGDVDFLHICTPHDNDFNEYVESWITKTNCKACIIHSTVKPGTTNKIQKLSNHVVVIYSPIRGVHTRFLKDTKRYTKFWSTSHEKISQEVLIGLKKRFEKTQRLEHPTTLELAKILVDTTYYGWLITYRKMVDMIAENLGADPDQLWSFAEEIHEFLENRPIMYNDHKPIGGHCVLQNLSLIDDQVFEEIRRIIDNYGGGKN